MMGSRLMACSNVGDRASGLWVVASGPCEVPEQEEREDGSQCSAHGVFDREDAAGAYAFRLSKQDATRACTPIMKLFGRAAIPTTAYEGVKSIIDRKMKAGGTSRPREIFENLLGETYGARGRKAD